MVPYPPIGIGTAVRRGVVSTGELPWDLSKKKKQRKCAVDKHKRKLDREIDKSK